jgi:hypothetical protein
MSETPLSDRITTVLSDPGAEARASFIELFLSSRLGVIIAGVPKDVAPGVYKVKSSDTVTMVTVTTPDGRRMVKACADPTIFAQRYEPAINGDMLGRDILEMTLKVDDVDGVLVCSAASFHSIPLFQREIRQILGGARPWWRLW